MTLLINYLLWIKSLCMLKMCLCFQSYKEKDAGKVVVYTTTMGIIRDTYQACMKVKQILRTLLVKFEERDVFMSTEYQNEIRERMRCDQILIPQVYIDGQHCGVIKTFLRLFTKLITFLHLFTGCWNDREAEWIRGAS